VKVLPGSAAGTARFSRLAAPPLNPQQVTLLNRLFARNARGTVSFGGRDCEFALAPRPRQGVWGLTLIGKWGGADVAVFLEPAPILDWLATAVSKELRGDDLRRLPPDMASAAVEVVLGEVLDVLAKASGQAAELTSVSFETKQALSGDGFVHFTLTGRSDAQAAHGVLVFSGGLAAAADGLAKLASGEPAWPRDLMAGIPIELSVEVGRTSVSLQDLRTVEPGDVVLADECAALNREREVRVRLGRSLTAPAVLNGKKVEIKGEFMADETKSVAPVTGKGAKEPAKLDSLQVHLVLELDSQYVTLKELQALRPGFVLETAKGLESPVSLKVNGSCVGKGELVQVGGKVGVRVLEIGAV